MNRFSVLPVFIFGLLSTLLTVFICIVITLTSGFFFQSFTLFFIIPIGGLVMGIICGLGVFLGLKLSNTKAKFKHDLLSVIFALIGFVLTYISLYIIVLHRSNGPVTFNWFLGNYVLNRTSIIHIGGAIAGPYKIGATLNWIKLIVEAIGFILGGLVVGSLVLGNKRYCEQCSKYMIDKHLYYVKSDDPQYVRKTGVGTGI